MICSDFILASLTLFVSLGFSSVKISSSQIISNSAVRKVQTQVKVVRQMVISKRGKTKD